MGVGDPPGGVKVEGQARRGMTTGVVVPEPKARLDKVKPEAKEVTGLFIFWANAWAGWGGGSPVYPAGCACIQQQQQHQCLYRRMYVCMLHTEYTYILYIQQSYCKVIMLLVHVFFYLDDGDIVSKKDMHDLTHHYTPSSISYISYSVHAEEGGD